MSGEPSLRFYKCWIVLPLSELGVIPNHASLNAALDEAKAKSVASPRAVLECVVVVDDDNVILPER